MCKRERVITTSIKQENVRLGSRALSRYIGDTTLPLHRLLCLMSYSLFSNPLSLFPLTRVLPTLSLVLVVILTFIVMKLLIWAAALDPWGDGPSRLINIHEHSQLSPQCTEGQPFCDVHEGADLSENLYIGKVLRGPLCPVGGVLRLCEQRSITPPVQNLPEGFLNVFHRASHISDFGILDVR